MEILVCGKAAVEACLKMRPAALREVFADERRARFFETLCEGVLRERRPWTLVSSSELSKLAGTSVHGGIVARTERPEPAQVRPVMRDEWAAAGEKILFVDGIGDSAQMASIARVAAVCGVTRIIADEAESLPTLTNSKTWSLCGGALEMLKLYRTESMAGMLRMMSEKFFVVGAVREGGRRVDYGKTPTFPGKPTAFLICGGENGVPGELISRCGYLLHIAEPAGAWVHYTPSEICAQYLPWLSAKIKVPGSGFLERKKMRKA